MAVIVCVKCGRPIGAIPSRGVGDRVAGLCALCAQVYYPNSAEALRLPEYNESKREPVRS